MSAELVLALGAPVVCDDGACGSLRRLVIDPVGTILTHVAVERRHPHGSGHLVPASLIRSTDVEVALACDLSTFLCLEDARETQVLWGLDGDGPADAAMSMLLYDGMGTGIGEMGPRSLVSDRLPPGEVAIRRGEHARATDGAAGRVVGIVVDAVNHRVTHLLVEEGHLRSRTRVSIPGGAVTVADDRVDVDLCRKEIRDLRAGQDAAFD